LGHVTDVCGKHLGHVTHFCAHRPSKWRSTLRRRSCGCQTLVVLEAPHDAIKHGIHAAHVHVGL